MVFQHLLQLYVWLVKVKTVLEIGAGPGSITRILREYNGCRVTAIELDEEAIEKAFTILRTRVSRRFKQPDLGICFTTRKQI